MAKLAEHWASIPKVVGSNPTVARHIFQACPVWIYTQSNITQASNSPEYITPTQQTSEHALAKLGNPEPTMLQWKVTLAGNQKNPEKTKAIL